MQKKGITSQQKQRLLSYADSIPNIEIIKIIPITSGSFSVEFNSDFDQSQVKEFLERSKNDQDILSIHQEVLFHTRNFNYEKQWDMLGKKQFKKKINWGGDNFDGALNILQEQGFVPGEDVVVGVLDTGYIPHSDIIGNFVEIEDGKYGFDFVSDCRNNGGCDVCLNDFDSSKNPNSIYRVDALDSGNYLTSDEIKCLKTRIHYQESSSTWHGSHVTGTIVSKMDEQKPMSMSGGSFGSEVIPMRVLGKFGGSE